MRVNLNILKMALGHYILVWTFLSCLIHLSYQECSSTVAVTTCTWDTLKAKKPYYKHQLQIPEYKSYLSVPKGNLDSIPSETFKNLPQVTTLEITSNKLKNLEDDSFIGLDNLKVLNLYDNQLTTIGSKLFRHCKKLEKLDLGLNKISSIDNEAFADLSLLKFLNLGFNSLKTVPSAINKLTGLTTLQLYSNGIENVKSNTFSSLNKLNNLKLNDNKIITIEKHAFKGLVNLKDLDISVNYLNNLNIDDLLGDAQNLNSVKLSINEFKCSILNEIISKLKKNNVQVVKGYSKSKNNIDGITCKV